MKKKIITLAVMAPVLAISYLQSTKPSQDLPIEKVVKEKMPTAKTSVLNTNKAVMPRKIQEVVIKKSEALLALSNIRNKAIKTDAEKQELNEFYTNSRNIRLAYLTLRATDFSDMDQSMERRIGATNFLIEAIQQREVDRTDAIKAAQMFLLSEIEESTHDLEARRLIIGDKVEIFHALSQYAPEEVKKFKENYMSERLKKVIKYVETNIQRSRG
ncbi:hypothetical protein [Halobacteriovorax sp. HLS]|uniref:hypothetical protein n=1 Tax=Halobacteriovorax sp. HLS TaxID=2234000 RepID=UPI000FDC7012|nr:hypothetical protein [Halobacteriovorax sp. HLS]